MSAKIGLWIDHKKAIIVFLNNGEVNTKTIESEVEPRGRMYGGSRSKKPYGPQDVASESKRDRRHRHHLEVYYERILQEIKHAEEFLIFGPGEAKTEFKKIVEKSKELAKRIVAVENADTMTVNQIISKVKGYYAQ